MRFAEALTSDTVGGWTWTVKWIGELVPGLFFKRARLFGDRRVFAVLQRLAFVGQRRRGPLLVGDFGFDARHRLCLRAADPANTRTITFSFGSVAVPLNDGAASLVGLGISLSVTTGDLVITSKVIGALSPGGFLIELGCVATAVYLPSLRALGTWAAHRPPLTVAFSGGDFFAFRLRRPCRGAR